MAESISSNEFKIPDGTPKIAYGKVVQKYLNYEEASFGWRMTSTSLVQALAKLPFSKINIAKSNTFEVGESIGKKSEWEIQIQTSDIENENEIRYLSLHLVLNKEYQLPKIPIHFSIHVYIDGMNIMTKKSQIQLLSQGSGYGWKKFVPMKLIESKLANAQEIVIIANLFVFSTSTIPPPMSNYEPLKAFKVTMKGPTIRTIVAKCVKQKGEKFGTMTIKNMDGLIITLPRMLCAASVPKIAKMLNTQLKWLPGYENYENEPFDMSHVNLDIMAHFIGFLKSTGSGCELVIIKNGELENPLNYFSKKEELYNFAKSYELIELQLTTFASMCQPNSLNIQNAASVAIYAKELSEIEDLAILEKFQYKRALKNLKNAFTANYEGISKTKIFTDNYKTHWEFFLDLIFLLDEEDIETSIE